MKMNIRFFFFFDDNDYYYYYGDGSAICSRVMIAGYWVSNESEWKKLNEWIGGRQNIKRGVLNCWDSKKVKENESKK